MDVRATRDTYEREEDEAERLVRPAPKIKPPRHDKERGTVEERDPDTSGDPDLKSDPDMSLNYKSVGGSLLERVLARFAAEDGEKPKSQTWVRVRNKEKNEVTRVHPDTLRDEPHLYEKVEDNEPHRDHEKPRPARKPERPHYHKDRPPHAPWPDPRPQPKEPVKPAPLPKAVKPVPIPEYPEPEKQPKVKPPGWVPKPREAAVLSRFLQAREFGSDESLKEYLKRHPDADPKIHWVKDQKDAPKEEEPKPPSDTPKAEEEKPKGKAPDDIATGQALWGMAGQDEALANRFETLLDPKKETFHIAQNNPQWPAANMFPGVKFPPGVTTVGQVFDALRKTPKPKKKGPRTPSSGKPAKPAQETPKAPTPVQEAPKAPTSAPEEEILKGIVPPAKATPAETPSAEESPEPKTTEPEKGAAPPAAQPEKPFKLPTAPKRENYSTGEEFAAAQDKYKGAIEKIAPALEKHLKAPRPKRDAFESEEEYEAALNKHKKTTQAIMDAVDVALGEDPQEKRDKAKEEKKKQDKDKKDKEKDKEKAEPKKPEGPQPERRPVSKEEKQAMVNDIVSSFPASVGLSLISADLHPDDYHRIKAEAQRASQVSLSLAKVDAHVEKLKQIPGKGDPAKVPPPEQARNKKGEMVPYDTLPPEEQAEAWAEYRNQCVGAYLGARTQLTSAYEKSGAPSTLARVLAASKLQNVAPEKVTEAVLKSGRRDDMSHEQRLKAIGKLSPEDKILASRFFQAQDYLDVRAKYLTPDSRDAVSEYSSPGELRKAMEEGSALLRTRAKAYPEEARDLGMGMEFRHRLLRRMEALDPDKATVVQRTVDRLDASEYDEASREWEKQTKDVEAELAKRQADREKLEAKVKKAQEEADERAEKLAERVKKDPSYHPEEPPPLPTLEEEITKAGLDKKDDPTPPKAPFKPPRYDLTKGITSTPKEQHQDLIEQGQKPPKKEEPSKEESKEEEPKEETTTKVSASTIVDRVRDRFLAFPLVPGPRQ